MRIIISVFLLLLPSAALAEQRCQEVDPENMARLEAVVQSVNERDGTDLTVSTFVWETVKSRVLNEIARNINAKAAAEMQAAGATQKQIQDKAAAEFAAASSQLDAGW